jgi:hypothetical protein
MKISLDFSKETGLELYTNKTTYVNMFRNQNQLQVHVVTTCDRVYGNISKCK